MSPVRDGHGVNTEGIRARVCEALSEWYPGATLQADSIRLATEKNLRWSRHFIYEVVSEYDRIVRKVLVKCPRTRDVCGQQQTEARPAGGGLRAEFEALRLLHRHLGAGQVEGLTAVRPLACFSDLDAVALEYRPGCDLRVLTVRAGRPWARRVTLAGVERAAERGGRLLAAIHQMPRDPYPCVRPFDRTAYEKRAAEHMETLARAGVSAGVNRRLRQACQLIRRVAPALAMDTVAAYLHGDMYPDNIVQLADGRVFAIDTTLEQTGSVEEDIARFIVGVETLTERLTRGGLGVRTRAVRAVNGAFLAGYARGARYAPRIVAAMCVLTALHHWIGLLTVSSAIRPSALGYALRNGRINPFMLWYFKRACADLERECRT